MKTKTSHLKIKRVFEFVKDIVYLDSFRQSHDTIDNIGTYNFFLFITSTA